MRESRRVMAHEIPMLISSLRCLLLLMLVLLVLLIMLYLLQKLHQRCNELLHIGIGWWWWQLLTTLVLVIIGT
jgi:uncharacterized membrane protein